MAMAKEKFDPSLFFNVEKIEDLKKLGENPDIKDFTNVFLDILKTHTLLRIMARLIEKDEKLPLKVMAKEINNRMMQILDEEDALNS